MYRNNNRYNLIFRWPQDAPCSGYDIIPIKSVKDDNSGLVYHKVNCEFYTPENEFPTDNLVNAVRCSEDFEHEIEILESKEKEYTNNKSDCTNKYNVTNFRIVPIKDNFISLLRSTEGINNSIKYRGSRNDNIILSYDEFGVKINDCVINYLDSDWDIPRNYSKINVTKKSIGSIQYLNILCRSPIENINIVNIYK